MTLGFERWANLPPSHSELQSFGYASVSEDGQQLDIKLMGIDGEVKFEKTLTAEEPKPVPSPSSPGSEETTVPFPTPGSEEVTVQGTSASSLSGYSLLGFHVSAVMALLVVTAFLV